MTAVSAQPINCTQWVVSRNSEVYSKSKNQEFNSCTTYWDAGKTLNFLTTQSVNCLDITHRLLSKPDQEFHEFSATEVSNANRGSKDHVDHALQAEMLHWIHSLHI